MIISIADNRKSKTWKNIELTWDEFLARAGTTKRTLETVEEYKNMSKKDKDEIKDAGGFVGGKLKDGKRKKGSVEFRSLITLDMDYAHAYIWDEITLFFDFKCCIYSTHKSTEDKPRLRLVIPLSRNISEEEYPAVSRMIAYDIGIELFDDTTYEPARLMYWPSTSADGVFIFEQQDGQLLNPDDILRRYDNWQDCSQWPVSKRQQKIIKRSVTRQEDPLDKDGIVGIFCRAYCVEEAMDKFLSHVYKKSEISGRYDYIPAESSAGVVIYDHKFIYSHHATDCAYGKLMNSFDAVRIHKFGHLDNNEDTEKAKQPSFKAMQEFAVKDEKVKMQIISEKQQQVQVEFAEHEDWKLKLEYNRQGVLINNLRNLIIILNNDEKLKSIVFNELSDGIEIKGTVPWTHPSKFWRDADDAQLISYIDFTYGNFSARNYDIAVSKVADDRSYHPIKDYLSSLPEWDKVKRADTLLIDYLGAEDNEYVRAVTRKTLCAAVKRVRNPGCKFDTMLVLCGPQGKGKSTLISKLSMEWFNDSMQLAETKDKTAAEKLQGYWILEIGELAGLRKAEVETLRGFLSRQNDIYRASFGKRATPHQRQCIFIGTTNAENGYLRDTTGNRRFWPVKTPGGGTKNSWDITQEEVDMIWAEIMFYCDMGEKLYLDGNICALAEKEQRNAMEDDDRVGMVENYLNMLLPADWDNMNIYERRNYIELYQGEDDRNTIADNCEGEEIIGFKDDDFIDRDGSEDMSKFKDDADNEVMPRGTIMRRRVCNMEIWCECFGRDRGSFKKQYANEITSIMAKIDGWKKSDTKVRFKIYGIVSNYEREV